MLVAAFPTHIFIDPVAWYKLFCKRFCDSNRYDYFSDSVYPHELIENHRDYIQPIVFLVFHEYGRIGFYHIFELPDGTRSCGIPLHFSPADVPSPGTATIYFTFQSDCFYSAKMSVYLSEEYANSKSLNGTCLNTHQFTLDTCGRIILPYYDFLWDEKWNNHAVFVFDIYLPVPGFPDAVYDSKNFLDPVAIMRLSRLNELSRLFIQRNCNWHVHIR